MKNGRKPLPPSVLKATGSYKPCKAGDRLESHDGLIPEAPRSLCRRGRVEWRRVWRLLHKLGIADSADGDVVAAYCQVLVDYVDALEVLRADGPVVESPHGKKANPASNQVIKLRDQMSRYITHLGLSPSARASLKRPTVEKAENQVKQDAEMFGGPKMAI